MYGTLSERMSRYVHDHITMLRCQLIHDYQITVKYLNSLVDLIKTNLANVEGSSNIGGVGYLGPMITSPLGGVHHLRQTSGTSKKMMNEHVLSHFRNIVAYIQSKKEVEQNALDSGNVVPGMSAGFAAGMGGGRWGSIEL
jgi:hypothetical protein